MDENECQYQEHDGIGYSFPSPSGHEVIAFDDNYKWYTLPCIGFRRFGTGNSVFPVTCRRDFDHRDYYVIKIKPAVGSLVFLAHKPNTDDPFETKDELFRSFEECVEYFSFKSFEYHRAT